ncbi:hypothetical protein WA158_004277 [Blastocystis sp. Blastoise]
MSNSYTAPQKVERVKHLLDRTKSTNDSNPTLTTDDFACEECELSSDSSPDIDEEQSSSSSFWRSPFSLLRSLVSKSKKRYQDKQFDLDLSYITPRIIAMGYPSSNMEGLYRNKLSDVVNFFNTRHAHHYKLYNLCIETVRHYDPEVFDNRVVGYPFLDHNAPPLQMMLDCCQDIHRFLNNDPNNIVAVHCKAGKGRTGVMISSYLYYSHQMKDIDSSLAFYADQRTFNKKGVTIPSQIRFVHYFGELVTLWNAIESIKRQYNIDHDVDPADFDTKIGSSYLDYPLRVPTDYIQQQLPSIYHGPIYVLDTDAIPVCEKYVKQITVYFGKKVKTTLTQLKCKITSDEDFYNTKDLCDNRSLDSQNYWICPLEGVKVHNEVMFQIFNGHKNIILQCWIHCAFIKNNKITIPKMELDLINHDKNNKEYDSRVSIEILFSDTE